MSVESSAGFIPEAMAKRVETAAQSAETGGAWPFLSYLINGIRRDDGREIPYSIVTGIDSKMMEFMQHDELGHRSGCDAGAASGNTPATAQLPPIIFNEWAGSDLQVKVGDRVTLDYYVWLEEGQLATRSTEFRVACIIPMKGVAADRDLVPDYPGITESETLGDWDPPFPIDLKRVRPQDEDYWKKYRTTPKGFIPLDSWTGALADAFRQAHVAACLSKSRAHARRSAASPGSDACAKRSTRCKPASRFCPCALRDWKLRAARQTSASTFSISASSWLSRRCS